MTDTINVPALVTRTVLLQDATRELEAAKLAEADLSVQINALQTKHFNAIANREKAANKVAQVTALPDTELPVDVYRKTSLIEQEALPERQRVKSVVFDYLFANPDATFDAIAEMMDNEGGPDRLHSYRGVVKKYIKNAKDAGMIPSETWDDFRNFILYIGKEKALYL